MTHHHNYFQIKRIHWIDSFSSWRTLNKRQSPSIFYHTHHEQYSFKKTTRNDEHFIYIIHPIGQSHRCLFLFSSSVFDFENRSAVSIEWVIDASVEVYIHRKRCPTRHFYSKWFGVFVHVKLLLQQLVTFVFLYSSPWQRTLSMFTTQALFQVSLKIEDIQHLFSISSSVIGWQSIFISIISWLGWVHQV